MANMRQKTVRSLRYLVASRLLFSLLFSLLPLLHFPSPAHAEVPAPSTVQAATGKDAQGNPVPSSDSTEDFRPKLSIPIPNVSLSAIKVQKGTGSGPGYVDVPWIAEYVSGVYKYAVGFAGLIATVMFMVGGFQYLTAGGDQGGVKAGKKRIADAIVGMLLVLGAYTLLRTVNPSLTTVTPLRIPVVAKKSFEIISPKNMIAATGKPALPAGPMVKLIREKAVAAGGPKFDCFVMSSVRFESGGRQDALGHDENAVTTVFEVLARKQFINSGIFASKATFPPVGCSDRSCQNKGPKNDDALDVTKPPDYGLDWRYSHGIGAGQSTIFPNSAPCPGKENQGRGFRYGSSCTTLPELLDANIQTDMMIAHYKSVWNREAKKGEDVAAGYVAYAGKIEKDNPIIMARVNAYNACAGGLPAS